MQQNNDVKWCGKVEILKKIILKTPEGFLCLGYDGHLLLLPSKLVSTSRTFQMTEELQLTESVIIIKKTQQDIVFNTRRANNVM